MQQVSKILFILLMPFCVNAQIYVDGSGYVRYTAPKPDTIRITQTVRDTIRINQIIRDTIRITNTVTIRDTICIDNPPPVTGSFEYTPPTPTYTGAVPGGKLETWSEQWLTDPGYSKQDGYFRFSWSMLEGAQGQYTFDKFDQQAQLVFNRGGRFGFGIMTHYPDAVIPHRLNYDGGYAVYPQYLHTLMQSESVKDWKASNGAWVPNWNSEAYITRLLALHKALDAHIKSKGWADRISYVDIRGYGAFGEWHSYTIADQMSQYPSGTRATEASLKRIIDAHTEGFPDFPLVALVAAFDAGRLGNTMNPPGVAHYVLTTSNRWGKLGWRRDNWGATDDYLRQYTSGNTYVVNGMRLDTAIMNRYKYAPVVGEPCCHNTYSQLATQLKQAGATSLGNGNISVNSTTRANMKAAADAIGSRLAIKLVKYENGKLYLHWTNTGTAPLYEAFNVVIGNVSVPLPKVLPGETVVQEINGVPYGDMLIEVKNNYRKYPLEVRVVR